MGRTFCRVKFAVNKPTAIPRSGFPSVSTTTISHRGDARYDVGHNNATAAAQSTTAVIAHRWCFIQSLTLCSVIGDNSPSHKYAPFIRRFRRRERAGGSDLSHLSNSHSYSACILPAVGAPALAVFETRVKTRVEGSTASNPHRNLFSLTK